MPSNKRPNRLSEFLLQLSSILGFLFPLGEVFGPWIFGRWLTRRRPELAWFYKDLLGFQTSWALYRFLVLILVAGTWLGASLKSAPQPSADDFSIPEAASSPRQAPQPNSDFRQWRDQAKAFQTQIEELKSHPQELFTQVLDQGPLIHGVSWFGLSLIVLLWLISMTLTLINGGRALFSLSPVYPLALWPKEKRG